MNKKAIFNYIHICRKKSKLKFVFKQICRKSTLGVTKYLNKVSCRQVTWLKKFQKNCHTEKSAVVLPTILLKDTLQLKVLFYMAMIDLQLFFYCTVKLFYHTQDYKRNFSFKIKLILTSLHNLKNFDLILTLLLIIKIETVQYQVQNTIQVANMR